MKTLFKIAVLLIIQLWVCESCEINHNELWKCAIENGASYGRKCIHAVDIHRQVSKQRVIMKPVLLGIEGPGYRKLFESCDTDNNECISMDEIHDNRDCERTCSWKKLFSEIMNCN